MGCRADRQRCGHWTLAASFVLLAGCAPQADKFAVPSGPDQPTALLDTFLSVCASLEDRAVADAAAALGFVPQPAPAESKRFDGDERVWLRQSGRSRAMLRWAPGQGECSLAASTADPDAVAIALQAEATRVAGDRISVGAALANGTRIAVAYRTPATAPRKLVFLGIQERAERRPLVVLVARAESAMPPAGTPPPPLR